MLTKNIKFKNFQFKSNILNTKKKLSQLLKKKNYIFFSMGLYYKDSYTKTLIQKFKKYKNFRIIGMGGSSLGTRAIYDFLKSKINKNFVFLDNLQVVKNKNKKYVNLIVSKSGNTIETIVNANIFIKKNEKNIFITENKNNYLLNLAQKLKSDIIHHSNYIGGRYSVLSEVGMLPAELMNLNPSKFRQFNTLIKNKNFLINLVKNVSTILNLVKNKKFNSVIINYDEGSDNLFKWYQQLVAESLGKKKKGILPIVSSMPKDNHSVMQLYLDGFKNNFFTFFYVHEKNSPKINNNLILSSKKFLKGKTLSKVIYAQKIATENVFKKKNIPFRSFEITKRDEKTLGELFCFFIMETILLGKCMDLNPYDQPSVELIKTETQKLLR